MQFYRCKCGEVQSWTTMGVAPCARCGTCGSNLAQGPEGHVEPEPHRFVTKYDTNTGKPFEVCERCSERRDRLEERGEA